MTTTTILAAIGALILILHTATRIPAALAELLLACLPLLRAVSELRAALRAHPPQTAESLTDKTPALPPDGTNVHHDDRDQ
ncbi:hypothetical protein [Nonomuraea soli]|uniref:Uncharacterized protein n=1 Tax=Nonomuraea soli TaxID=1032476 RepID=A0A7W0CJH7_9ACTN|nr:hypothetical protein [Nonomuraea soli]MBA2892354.1 hypothetical protein [Nonomuraea soli]